MPGLVPGIHALWRTSKKAWMAGPSPAMTISRVPPYSSGLNPTSSLPSPNSSTGRLIIDGCASISAIAFFSVRPSLSLSGSLRNVVPARLSSVSQPAFFAQPSSFARSMPAVL